MNRSRPGSVAASERLLRRYAHERSPADLDALVRRFQPLARSLAHRYRLSSVAADDLEQAAYLGLVKAIRGFDPARGCAFSTFAVPTILGEVRRQCRSAMWPAHVPRPVQERVQRVRSTGGALRAELRRAPSVRELAARLEWKEEWVIEALTAARTLGTVSLDDAQEDDYGETGLAHRVGAEDPGFELLESRMAIETALPALDEDERRVLRLRYAHERTFAEIGRELAITAAQAARLTRRSEDHLRALAGDSAAAA